MSDIIMKYLWLAVFLIIWCVVHSAMISVHFTDYVKSKFGRKFRFYRLFFNVVAAASLTPLGLYAYSMQSQPIFHWEGYLRICQIIMLVIVVLLFFAGARHYSILQLLGIRQLKEGILYNVLNEHTELDTTGILGVIRHPWYAAVIVLIWARSLDASAILVNVIFTGYLVIGSFLEEQKLILEFGEKYREYQRKVSMFVPYKWLKKGADNDGDLYQAGP